MNSKVKMVGLQIHHLQLPYEQLMTKIVVLALLMLISRFNLLLSLYTCHIPTLIYVYSWLTLILIIIQQISQI